MAILIISQGSKLSLMAGLSIYLFILDQSTSLCQTITPSFRLHTEKSSSHGTMAEPGNQQPNSRRCSESNHSDKHLTSLCSPSQWVKHAIQTFALLFASNDILRGPTFPFQPPLSFRARRLLCHWWIYGKKCQHILRKANRSMPIGS